MSLTNIQAALADKGYREFSRPFELNIVGVRSDNTRPNLFDDTLNVYYKTTSGDWQLHSWPATTDPGTYWLENPLNPQGTAILKAGQYPGSHAIGMHRGKYLALVQVRPVTVLRDYERKAVLDFMNGKEDTGLFGINIHHALGEGTTRFVDKFSAGCQVFANVEDFNLFMSLCQRHKQLYGNEFTYTLIDERALIREAKKN
ncbi:hypothetical protein [Puia dinghuensis]|uniref:Uncharacterized protein n=1 Tax=Puia dinghuensis TaxID=1792502 RepID=A0A8J2XPZ6_9BACT|nr:hypothetical protein [Puia dinghuensis]GGA89929.1 hypothetical protein GCM10011511_11460 [Puia dinghuensis]